MKKISAILSVAGLALIAPAAFGSAFTMAGGAIPDNAPANPLVITFNVTDTGPVTGLDLTLTNLAHTWAGDLIITLTAPGGTVADIMRRSSTTAASTVGDSSNFLGNYRFIDGGGNLATALAAGGDTFNVPAGDYQATTRVTVPGSLMTPVLLNTVFNGVEAFGTWTLRISDNAAADLGSVGSATLNIIPAPGAVALAGFAGLAGLRRRR